MYEKPKLDTKYKAENWRDFPQDDRLRCHVCKGIYWRLWADVAQCMGCRSFTGLETNGPGKTLRDVDWVNFALTSDGGEGARIRDPISGRAEWLIFHNKLKGRTSDQELVLAPTIKGTWLMAQIAVMPKKAMAGKEAINMFKKSNALKNRRAK